MAVSVRSTFAAQRAAGTSHPITLPSGVQSGDVLVVCVAYDEVTGGLNAISTSSSGWALIEPAQEQGANMGAAVFWKRATGSNALTVGLDQSQEVAYVSVAIEGDAGDPLAAGDNGSTVPADITALTVPSGDYLALLFLCTDANPPVDRTITDPTTPIAYSPLAESEATSTGNKVSTYALQADDIVTGTSINPGTISFSPTDQWVTWNVAIPDTEVEAGPPTVNAGADASVEVGEYFERIGTWNNNGSAITDYTWECISGPHEGTTTDTSGFGLTPTVAGVDVWQFTATNAFGTSEPDTMTLTITTGPPGSVYPLDNWKITLPTDGGDSGTTADEILQPALNSYTDSNFLINSAGRMEMRAPVQGATTGGSGGTRSELREMEGGNEAAWTPFDTDGVRQLTVTMRVDPTDITDRQDMIIGQIHGESGSPPIYLAAQWESNATTPVTPRVRVFKDGPGVDPNLLVGTLDVGVDFTYRIRYDPPADPEDVRGGTLSIFTCIGDRTNLPTTPSHSWRGDEFVDNIGWYFKAGAYNKSEVADGGTGTAIAEISHLELLQPGDVPETETYRLYLANSPAGGAPDPLAFWDDNATGDNPYRLSATPSGPPTSISVAETSTDPAHWVLLGLWVSDPAAASGTITGEFAFTAGWRESNAAANFNETVSLWVADPSGAWRGSAINIYNAIAELPTTATAFEYNDVTPGSVAFQAGDRLVLELGYRSTNTVGTEYTGTLHFGGTDTPDLAGGDTDMDRPGWIDLEITSGVTFEPAASGAISANLPVPSATLTGSQAVTGQLSGLSAPVSASLFGLVSVPGVLSSGLPQAIVALTGAIVAAGQMATTLPLPSSELSGAVSQTGSLAGPLPLPASELGGLLAQTGTLAAALPAPTSAVSGIAANPATLSATLPVPLAAMAGGVLQAGALGSTLPAVEATLSGTADTGGLVLSATLPTPAAELQADTRTSGAVSATLPSPAAEIDAEVRTSGSLSATLPLPSSSLGAGGGAAAELSSTLPTPAAALSASLRDEALLSGTLPLPGAVLGGDGSAAGDVAGSLVLPVVSLTGDVANLAALTGSLPIPSMRFEPSTAEGQLLATLGIPTGSFAGQVRVNVSLTAALPLVVVSLRGTELETHGPGLHAGQPVVPSGVHAGGPSTPAVITVGAPRQPKGVRAGVPTRSGTT